MFVCALLGQRSINKSKQCTSTLFMKYSVCVLAPGPGNVEVLQVFRKGCVLGEGGQASVADGLPGAHTASMGVAFLLLKAQVRSTQPILILSLALQSLNCVALHLPCDWPWPAPFSYPLPAGNSLPQ